VGDAAGLSRRKTLRAFRLQGEPGETCTCCGAREPLRGADASRRGVLNFWSEAAPRFGIPEVRPGGRERLCAVCTVKRLLPRVAPRALGWSVSTAFPSTATLASLPWRLAVVEASATNAGLGEAVAALVRALQAQSVPERPPHDASPALPHAAEAWPEQDRGVARAFLAEDGDRLYPQMLRDADREGPTVDQRPVLAALSELRGRARHAGIVPPGTSYALLAMDGDHMGALLRDHAGRKRDVSAALGAFSAEVPGIVEGPKGNGRLIYAGGDDVLALLPTTTALPVASRLRKRYAEAFAERVPGVQATISAGLVYAHMRAPLQQVVRTAHALLDDDAKRRAGRDALAVAVWKRPGIVLRFASGWRDEIVPAVETLRSDIEVGRFSRGFLYSLRRLLEATQGLQPEQVRLLLAAEYMKSREHSVSPEEAGRRVEVLQRLVPAVGDPTDPVLFAAFLAAPGEEA